MLCVKKCQASFQTLSSLGQFWRGSVISLDLKAVSLYKGTLPRLGPFVAACCKTAPVYIMGAMPDFDLSF